VWSDLHLYKAVSYMNKLVTKYLLILLSSLFISVHASTMYSLTGVTKGYPLVEISGSIVDKSYKQSITDALKEKLLELKIDISGYDQRALAILISESFIANIKIINLQLLVGEQVQRLDTDKKTFAATYIDTEKFQFTDKDSLEENIEDAVDELLEKFSQQYLDDNKAFKKIKIDQNSFASALGYETNYKKALERSKREKKNLLLVLVANYCPWCRKFEQRVLIKEDVHKIITKNYIPLILNREKKEFPKEFDKAFTPIVHFIDYKSEKSYKSMVGYNNRESFLYQLKKDQKNLANQTDK